MTERQTANIRIDNVKETVAYLREFDAEVLKAINATIKDSLYKVRDLSSSKYPKGSWVVRVNKKNLLGYIAARSGGARGKSWGESAGGVRAGIFEFIGSRYSGNRPQVTGLIDSLNRRYGQPGRFLWAAWDEGGQTALEEIKNTLDQTQAYVQRRLDSIGQSR